MEIKKPLNLFVRAMVVKNEIVQLISEDENHKPFRRAARIEMKPQMGPGVPKHPPYDNRIVLYIHENSSELWAGVDIGREYEILLQPKMTEAEEKHHQALKKAAKIKEAEVAKPAEVSK